MAAGGNVQEFRWAQAARWAALRVTGQIGQQDVDQVFASVDTTGWFTRPTWDAANQVVTWQVLAAPYGQPVSYGPGSVIAAERRYVLGAATSPSTQAQVVAYGPGQWSDTAVAYL